MDVREARSEDEVTEALALRSRVFCGEQGVSFEADQDGRDPEATHIVAVDDGAVIGTCRLLFRGPVARLGRLAVVAERRGDGIAAAISSFGSSKCLNGTGSSLRKASASPRLSFEFTPMKATSPLRFSACLRR